MGNLSKGAISRKEALVGLMRLGLYLLLFVTFFAAMAVNNRQLLNASRTLATTLLTYLICTAAMMSVYGGYDVGRKKPRPIISSMCLGTFVTDVVTYFQLEIMNVNSSKNETLQLFGEDFPFLIIAFVIQAVVIWIMVHAGTKLFFKLHPPKKSLLIYSTEKARREAERKILHFRLQWSLENCAAYDDCQLDEKISSAEAVFLSDGIPGSVRESIIHSCYFMKREIVAKAQLGDIIFSNANQIMIDDAPFYEIDNEKMSLHQRILKRAMDIVVSLIVLIVLSPLMAVISVCILLEDGKPVIFHQKRKTIDGRDFTISKFRTMKKAESLSSHHFSATSDDDRITKVGRVLRKFRVDEIPQLWNILKGDMSLVGPRPEMLENVEKYTASLPDFRLRESVKAGLTGLAQIEGKYNTSPEDKLMLDLSYIENYSLLTDVKLLFRTLTVFFKKDSTEGFDSSTQEGETK